MPLRVLFKDSIIMSIDCKREQLKVVSVYGRRLTNYEPGSWERACASGSFLSRSGESHSLARGVVKYDLIGEKGIVRYNMS